MFKELQQLWEATMEELGIFDEIVNSFDSVGEM